jgi:hypothetical protein
MPDPAPSAAKRMPLFYSQIVGVDPKLHAGLRLDRSSGFGFAATAQFVPIGLQEFAAAAQDFPILFTADAPAIPIALLGLQARSNLFIQPDGSWRPETYVPAYVRAFPFVFVPDAKSRELFLGMEPDADCLRVDRGEPLFEGEKPSKALNEAIALTAALRENLVAAEELARTLDQAGLLEVEEAKIDFVAGGSTVVRGFKVLKRERLDQVDDQTFLEWRHRNWLPAIYAHIASTGRWVRLMEAAARERPRVAH